MDRYDARASVIIGDYVFDAKDLLGTGSTARVYSGLHSPSFQKCAIKEFTLKEHSLSQYEKESTILKQIQHRNIVGFYDDKEVSLHKYIILEYCSGNNVRTTLSKPENYYGFSPQLFFKFLSDLTEGLNHLNKIGIDHRDIKPENILEHFDDYHKIIFKISDFGTAKLADNLDPNDAFMVGTTGYLAPEALALYFDKGPKITDFQKTDLWSTGVTLCYIASGNHPFSPSSGPTDVSTMRHMINNKPTNAISAEQNPNNLTVSWSENLPDTCRISSPQKKVLEKILAHLLKTDFKERSSFNDYYQAVQKFLKFTIPVEVFYTNTGEILTILLDKETPVSFNLLQELIIKETDIHLNYMLLMVNGNVAGDYWRTPIDIRDQLRNTEAVSIFLCDKDQLLTNQPKFEEECLIAKTFDALLLDVNQHNDTIDLNIFKENTGIAFLKMENMNRNHQKQRLSNEALTGLANMVKEKSNDLRILKNINDEQTVMLENLIQDIFEYIHNVNESVSCSILKSNNSNLLNYYKRKQTQFSSLRNKAIALSQECQKINNGEISNIIDFVKKIKENYHRLAPLIQVHNTNNSCSSCNHGIVKSLNNTYSIIRSKNKREEKHQTSSNYDDAHHTMSGKLKNKSDIKEFMNYLEKLLIQETDCRLSLSSTLYDNYDRSAKNVKLLNKITLAIKQEEEKITSLSNLQINVRKLNKELHSITSTMPHDITTVSNLSKKK
ncbi:MAG: protein kinase [Endozoicomonadaceae bacterium]|nr:protein kinase [Endozoicomonadaceae bacterium]